MTPKTQVEVTQKCRRFFYDRITGRILGVASGGGALDKLHGEVLVIATFNDVDAFSRIGVVECYYTPVGQEEPYSVDLAKVAEMESTSQAFHEHLETHNHTGHQIHPDNHACCGDSAQALCNARDVCVSYVFPEE
jgi:hypothetical protein